MQTEILQDSLKNELEQKKKRLEELKELVSKKKQQKKKWEFNNILNF